jgi:hypothetical protein
VGAPPGRGAGGTPELAGVRGAQGGGRGGGRHGGGVAKRLFMGIRRARACVEESDPQNGVQSRETSPRGGCGLSRGVRREFGVS